MQLLERQVEVEQRQAQARARVQELEEAYREQDAERQGAVQQHEALRGELERRACSSRKSNSVPAAH